MTVERVHRLTKGDVRDPLYHSGKTSTTEDPLTKRSSIPNLREVCCIGGSGVDG